MNTFLAKIRKIVTLQVFLEKEVGRPVDCRLIPLRKGKELLKELI
jgi:hypothetical protein